MLLETELGIINLERSVSSRDPHFPPTGVTAVCCCTQLFYMGSGIQTHACAVGTLGTTSSSSPTCVHFKQSHLCSVNMHKDYVPLKYSLGKLSCQLLPVYLTGVSYDSDLCKQGKHSLPFYSYLKWYAGAAACPSSSSKSLRQAPKRWQILNQACRVETVRRGPKPHGLLGLDLGFCRDSLLFPLYQKRD